jgi:hypothetical protein
VARIVLFRVASINQWWEIFVTHAKLWSCYFPNTRRHHVNHKRNLIYGNTLSRVRDETRSLDGSLYLLNSYNSWLQVTIDSLIDYTLYRKLRPHNMQNFLSVIFYTRRCSDTAPNNWDSSASVFTSIEVKKVKISLCLIREALLHEYIWGSGDVEPPFLTSALCRVEWSVSRPYRFTIGERASGTHWVGHWTGPM